MSVNYYLSTRPGNDGKYLIHLHDCPFLPQKGKRIFLGIFGSGIKSRIYRIWLPPFIRYCPYCLAKQYPSKAMNLFNKEEFKTKLTRIPDKCSLIDVMFCSES